MASHQLRPELFVLPVLVLTFTSLLLGQTASSDTDKSIKEKLAAPAMSLDEQHQGPTMIPRDLPDGIMPFDCRATEVFLHRVRPGQYHFERAQRLLGLGIDVIGCEAFGLDRFSKAEDERIAADQAVKEAEAAATLPIGLEQWRPGALRYILISAYRNAADVHRSYALKHNAKEEDSAAREFKEKLRKVEGLEDDAFPQSSTQRPPLVEAVLKGEQERVAELLQAHAEAESRDADHATALRVAVVIGRTELVQLLLDHGVKPDVSDEEGTTALMDACAIGRSRIAASLLSAGADPNATATDGSTPLLESIDRLALARNWETRREMVNTLIKSKARVNVADWEGVTPLIAAARTGDTELVNALIGAGAEVGAADQKGGLRSWKQLTRTTSRS